MKKKIGIVFLLLFILVVGIIYFWNHVNKDKRDGTMEQMNVANDANGYTSITMEDAKRIFATPGDYVIVDVRRADEFCEGHIKGAINIANESITDKEPEQLADKDQVIYVYCRSGNRSKQASKKLVAMGYTHIIEFGGILDWTGEIEK